MWAFYFFVGVSILSILVYAVTNKHLARLVQMQRRAFHFHSKAKPEMRPIGHLRKIYLGVVLALIVYHYFVYLSIFQ